MRKLLLSTLLAAVSLAYSLPTDSGDEGSWDAWGALEIAAVPVSGSYTGTFGVRGAILLPNGWLSVGVFANTVASDVSRNIVADSSIEIDYETVGLLVEPQMPLTKSISLTAPLRIGAGRLHRAVQGTKDTQGGGGFFFLSPAIALGYNASENLGFWLGGGYIACPGADDPVDDGSGYRGPHVEFGIKYGTLSQN